MSNSSKRFCPLRSTAAKTAECSENCMWYVPSDDTDQTCAVVHSLVTLGVLIDIVEHQKK